MDIDLTLLGPYAIQFQKEQKKAAEFNAKRGEPVPSTSSAGAAARRVNFTALYKKQNLKFSRDIEARRQGRHQNMEEHRKLRRSQKVLEGRKATISEMTNEFNQLVQEDSSNEISKLLEESSETGSPIVSSKILASMSTSEQSDQSTNNMNNSNGSGKDINIANENSKNLNSMATKNGSTVVTAPITTSKNNANANSRQDQNKKPIRPPPPPSTISQSRRDQLQKWKKEKEAADLQAKRVIKQPFKMGAPVVNTNTKPQMKGMSSSLTSVVKSASNTTNANSLPKGSSNVSVPGSKSNIAGVVTSSRQRQPTVPTTGRVPPAQLTGVSRTGVKPLPAAASGNGEVRRVTRAMTKLQTPTTTVGGVSNNLNDKRKEKNGGTGLGIAKPPLQKMKTLNISDKQTTSTAAGRGAAVMHPGGAKSVAVGRNATTSATASSAVGVKKANVSGAGRPLPSSQKIKDAKKVEGPCEPTGKDIKETPHPQQQSSSELQTPSPPQPEQSVTVKKKKAKPKPIDEIYTDYNGRFSDACRKLGGLAAEWRHLLEENKDSISEEIQGNIYSNLGAVKLLLESKLPQFGELLYTYLLKDEDKTIILGCDLEGWWDVAHIQVEAVYKAFEGLTEVKNNNWTTPEPTPSNLKPRSSSSSKENFTVPAPPRRQKIAAKAQASGGLKAFLANKRKMFGGTSAVESECNTNEEESMDVSTSMPSSSLENHTSNEQTNAPTMENSKTRSSISKSNLTLTLTDNLSRNHDDEQPSKTFEGGFFTVNSPLATPTTPRENARRISNSSSYVTTLKGSTPVSAVPLALRTPTHLQRLSGVTSDASLRRASLSMLGVRRSMGTFSKIGVVTMFEDENRPAEEAMII